MDSPHVNVLLVILEDAVKGKCLWSNERANILFSKAGLAKLVIGIPLSTVRKHVSVAFQHLFNHLWLNGICLVVWEKQALNQCHPYQVSMSEGFFLRSLLEHPFSNIKVSLLYSDSQISFLLSARLRCRFEGVGVISCIMSLVLMLQCIFVKSLLHFEQLILISNSSSRHLWVSRVVYASHTEA